MVGLFTPQFEFGLVEFSELRAEVQKLFERCHLVSKNEVWITGTFTSGSRRPLCSVR